jgi:DNA mismatch endonuclease (patch repair protein)
VIDAPSRPADPRTSTRLRAQRRRGTKPELEIRRELTKIGLRYRLHRRLLSGLRREVDIVLGATRLAVDIRGCWWHGCPSHVTRSRNNAEWWAAKIEANRRRDADTERRLVEAGWQVIVVWEHEDAAEVALRLRAIARERKRNLRRVDWS